jgi:thymidylate kinase
MFIVIEGTDASGKSSLIAAVEHELNERFATTPMRLFTKGVLKSKHAAGY